MEREWMLEVCKLRFAIYFLLAYCCSTIKQFYLKSAAQVVQYKTSQGFSYLYAWCTWYPKMLRGKNNMKWNPEKRQHYSWTESWIIVYLWKWLYNSAHSKLDGVKLETVVFILLACLCSIQNKARVCKTCISSTCALYLQLQQTHRRTV